MVARVFIVVIALVAGLAPLSARRQPAAARDALILITLDGVRWADMFGGLDAGILRSTLAKDARLEDSAAYKRFNAATPAERREKLMPFFWTELMAKHGSIAGNRALGSSVGVTNTHRFSYPGYCDAAAAASRTSAASVALLADGFSVSTCRPAATAARFQGPWRLLGSGL